MTAQSFLFILILRLQERWNPQALLQDHSNALRVKHEGHVHHQYSSKFNLDQFNLHLSFKKTPDLININLVKYFSYVKAVAEVDIMEVRFDFYGSVGVCPFTGLNTETLCSFLILLNL